MSSHAAFPPQVRAARGLLNWSQTVLSQRADLALQTVIRFETGRGPRVSADAQAKMTAALEAAGVIFVQENGDGPGVRMKKLIPTSQLRVKIEAFLARADPETQRRDKDIQSKLSYPNPADAAESEADTRVFLEARKQNLIDRNLAKPEDFEP